MLPTTLDWLLALPVDHSRQPVALKWYGGQLWIGVNFIFAGKYLFSELINVFLNKKFHIKWNKMISKYRTIHILLTNVHFDCMDRVSVTGMLAGMNLSKRGMNLSKPGMNLSNPGKTQQPCYNFWPRTYPSTVKCAFPLWILCVHYGSYFDFTLSIDAHNVLRDTIWHKMWQQ